MGFWDSLKSAGVGFLTGGPAGAAVGLLGSLGGDSGGDAAAPMPTAAQADPDALKFRNDNYKRFVDSLGLSSTYKSPTAGQLTPFGTPGGFDARGNQIQPTKVNPAAAYNPPAQPKPTPVAQPQPQTPQQFGVGPQTKTEVGGGGGMGYGSMKRPTYTTTTPGKSQAEYDAYLKKFNTSNQQPGNRVVPAQYDGTGQASGQIIPSRTDSAGQASAGVSPYVTPKLPTNITSPTLGRAGNVQQLSAALIGNMAPVDNIASAERLTAERVDNPNSVLADQGKFQALDTSIPTWGQALMDKTAGAASDNLNYQRDVNGNYGDYVNRNTDALSKALELQRKRETDTIKNQAAQRALQNYGGTDKAVQETNLLKDLQFLTQQNDILNTAQGFKREDVAANESLRSKQIADALGVSGQQFSRGLQGADFSRQGILADRAGLLDRAKLTQSGNESDAANRLKAEIANQDATFQAGKANQDATLQTDRANQETALQVAKANQSASQRQSELGLQASGANVDNMFKALGINNDAANSEFNNNLLGTQAYNTAATSANTLARQAEMDRINAILQEYNLGYGQNQDQVKNILQALGLGGSDVSSARNAATNFTTQANAQGMDQTRMDAEAQGNLLSALQQRYGVGRTPMQFPSNGSVGGIFGGTGTGSFGLDTSNMLKALGL